MTTRPTVLFVCYQNAGRSRMAEAYLELLAGDRYQAPPAGLEPTEHTHPEAIQVMAEEGSPLRTGEASCSPRRAPPEPSGWWP
jgi:arsenate reductase